MSLAQPTTHSNNSSASSTVSAPLRATTVTTTTATTEAATATTVDSDAAPDTKKTWSCPKCTFDNALSPEQVIVCSVHVVGLKLKLDEESECVVSCDQAQAPTCTCDICGYKGNDRITVLKLCV